MTTEQVIKTGLRKVVGTMETFSKGKKTVIRDRRTKKIIKVVINDGHLKGCVRQISRRIG